MPHTIVYANRDLWFDDARVGPPHYTIGASTVSAVLGMSPWKSPWEVWFEHREKRIQQPETVAQRRGNRLEPVLATWYQQEKTKLKVDRSLCRVWADAPEWLAVSPDGLIGGEGVLEIKTSYSPEGWATEDEVITDCVNERGLVPDHYLVQGLAQLAATRREYIDWYVGIQDRQEFIATRRIRMLAEPHEGLMNRLVRAVGEWRERHLVRGEPPPIDESGACNAWLAEIERKPVSRPATDQEAALIAEYVEIKRRSKADEERLDALKNLILGSMGDLKTLTSPVGRATAVTTKGRQSLSWERVQRERPELAHALFEADMVARGKPSCHLRIFGNE